MLGAVSWEIIHWPELRCLFLAGGRSQQFSSLVWRSSGTLVQIYKSQGVGTALWVPLALGQALAVPMVVKELSQCTNTYWSEGKELF